MMYINTDNTLMVIYSQRLAGYLMQRGYVLVRIAPDNTKNNRNIFLFNKSKSLDIAIEEYISRK